MIDWSNPHVQDWTLILGTPLMALIAWRVILRVRKWHRQRTADDLEAENVKYLLFRNAKDGRGHGPVPPGWKNPDCEDCLPPSPGEQ